jgi:hypothetical protein
VVGFRAILLSLRTHTPTHTPSTGHSFGQELILKALPTESAHQSVGIVPFLAVEGYQIPLDDDTGMGQRWTAGLLAGIQYSEPAHPPEGLCLSHILSEVC